MIPWLRFDTNETNYIVDKQLLVQPLKEGEALYRPPVTSPFNNPDGRTWRKEKLAGGQLHETSKALGIGTIGYSALRQVRDDLIHLITTMTEHSCISRLTKRSLMGPTNVTTTSLQVMIEDV